VPAFLVKTEPSEYSFQDLVRDHHAIWDGISNPLALIHLRSMRRGDNVAVYHTGHEKAVVGVAEAACDPYPDPKLDDPRRVVIDLVPRRTLAVPVSLADFRDDEILRASDLVRLPRLSVLPLTDAQLRRLLALADSPARRVP
jgi:predicted RNA-binding protein with PUA-like domain